MKRATLFLLLILMAVHCAPAAISIPPLTGRVNDTAGMLSASQSSTLERMLSGLEETNSSQVVLLTVPNLQGLTIEDFAIRVAESWKIGQKGLDNGVILVVALKERKIRIEVGYGLEPLLTDAKSDYIIRRLMIPRFREGDYYQGIHDGLEQITGIIRRDFDISPEEMEKFRKEKKRKSGKSPIPIGLIILIFIILSSIGGKGGRGGGGSGTPFIFFGGGGSGGGSSSGGGFGGFSGGGGSFGGGGASGGW